MFSGESISQKDAANNWDKAHLSVLQNQVDDLGF